jgi:putative membrane protein
MTPHYYWNDLYAGWGWFLWFGIIMLMFSSFGNWGYTYSAHRRYTGSNSSKDAFDLLSERYARGEIDREEFHKVKNELLDLKANSNKASDTQKTLRPQTNA